MTTPDPEDADYVCTLDEASLKVACEELKEDPKERLGQVQALRKWIREQKHLKCPTDTRYLLKFLRTAKFSQLRAREILENHLKTKTKYPEWLNDLDLSDPETIKLCSTGYIMVIPKHTPKGRRLLINDIGALDMDKKKWDKTKMIRTLFGLTHYYLLEERDVVNGFEFFQDFTHFSMKLLTFWGMDTAKKTTKIWQGNFPGRFKAFHYYNPGPVFETMMAVTRPLLSKKFQDRIVIHGRNMEDVYHNHLPMEYFPDEYLPDDYKGPSQGTCQSLADKLVADITSPRVRDRVLYETSSQWYYDFKLKPEDAPAESFRKLNID